MPALGAYEATKRKHAERAGSGSVRVAAAAAIARCAGWERARTEGGGGGADWSQARTLAGMAVMKPTSLPERSARTPTCHSRRKCGGLRALRDVRMSGTRSRGGDGLGEGSPAEEGDGVVEAEHVVVVLHVVFVEQRVDVQHLQGDATFDGEGGLEARPA